LTKRPVKLGFSSHRAWVSNRPNRRLRSWGWFRYGGNFGRSGRGQRAPADQGVDLYDITESRSRHTDNPLEGNRRASSVRIGGRLSTEWSISTEFFGWRAPPPAPSMELAFTGSTLSVNKVNNSAVGPGDRVELSDVNGTLAVLDLTRGLYFSAPNGIPVPHQLPANFAINAVIAASIEGSTIPIASPGVSR